MVIEKCIFAITYLGCIADTWGTIHTWGNEKGKPQQIQNEKGKPQQIKKSL